MSLKAFHIVFIVVSIALCAFVTAWSLREWNTAHSSGALALGGLFLVCGFALVAYGVRAVRKLRDVP
jgi:hypothetical protein